MAQTQVHVESISQLYDQILAGHAGNVDPRIYGIYLRCVKTCARERNEHKDKQYRLQCLVKKAVEAVENLSSSFEHYDQGSPANVLMDAYDMDQDYDLNKNTKDQFIQEVQKALLMDRLTWKH